MPRIPRGLLAGHVDHVLNRGNGLAVVFHKDDDYRAFLGLLAAAKARFPVRLLGFCLMPNHFQLALQPATASTLGPFLQGWLTSHVRRYHRHYDSSGHVWQGRFKSFPIQQDTHLLTVLRYVLWNPVRAGLAQGIHDRPWTTVCMPPRYWIPVPFRCPPTGRAGWRSRSQSRSWRRSAAVSPDKRRMALRSGKRTSRPHTGSNRLSGRVGVLANLRISGLSPLFSHQGFLPTPRAPPRLLTFGMHRRQLGH